MSPLWVVEVATLFRMRQLAWTSVHAPVPDAPSCRPPGACGSRSHSHAFSPWRCPAPAMAHGVGEPDSHGPDRAEVVDRGAEAPGPAGGATGKPLTAGARARSSTGSGARYAPARRAGAATARSTDNRDDEFDNGAYRYHAIYALPPTRPTASASSPSTLQADAFQASRAARAELRPRDPLRPRHELRPAVPRHQRRPPAADDRPAAGARPHRDRHARRRVERHRRRRASRRSARTTPSSRRARATATSSSGSTAPPRPAPAARRRATTTRAATRRT